MSVKRSALPKLKPGLAKLVDKTPESAGWIHEMKYDGYRIMSHIQAGKVTLRSRNDLDWTARFKNIADALMKVGKRSTVLATVLDGEIVVFDKNGHSSFSALQKKLSEKSETGFYYMIFDIPVFNGEDLRDRPLLERKKILYNLVKTLNDRHVRFSTHLTSHGAEAFEAACQRKLEGIISKKAQSPYPIGRNGDWLKSKCRNEQEFLICGFTEPRGQREGFGSLLLGYWNKNHLIYCGRVGTGFDSKSLKAIMGKLKSREITDSIFNRSLSWQERKGAHYVRPELVAQVKFTERTPDGHLRHPVFLGLRQDKSPREIKRSA